MSRCVVVRLRWLSGRAQSVSALCETRVRTLRRDLRVGARPGCAVDLFETDGRRVADDVKASALVGRELLALRRWAPRGFSVERQAFLDLRVRPEETVPLFQPHSTKSRIFPWHVCFSEDSRQAAVVLEAERQLRIGDPYASAIGEWGASSIWQPAYAGPVRGIEMAVHYLSHDAYVLSLQHLSAAAPAEADSFDVIVRVWSGGKVCDAPLARNPADAAPLDCRVCVGDFVALYAQRAYLIGAAEAPLLLWRAEAPPGSLCVFAKKGRTSQSCFRMGDKAVYDGQNFFDVGVDVYRLLADGSIQVCVHAPARREVAVFDILAGTCLVRLAHAGCEHSLCSVSSCCSGARFLALTGPCGGGDAWLHLADIRQGATHSVSATRYGLGREGRYAQAALSPDGTEGLLLSERALRILRFHTGEKTAAIVSERNTRATAVAARACCMYVFGDREAITASAGDRRCS